MRKLILPIMLILCAVTIGLNGCFFILKGDTSSTLLFPADIEDRKKVDKQTLRVYPLQVFFDSTDLTAYEIVGYRYDSSSIRNVETRISKRFDSFWRQQTNILVQKKPLGNFSDLVDAEVFVRQRPMGDQNNNTAFRSISRISSRFLLSDTFYHLLSSSNKCNGEFSLSGRSEAKA